MKRVSMIVVAAIVIVALGAVPAFALQERGQAGQSGQSGERGGGAAVGRPGGAGGPSGGGSGPGGSSGSSVGGGGFGGGPSGPGGGGSMGSAGGGAGSSRLRGGDFGRSNPRGAGGDRTAVVRGDGGGPGKGATPSVTGEGAASYSAGRIREIPQYSRPRGTHPATGQAMPRGEVVPSRYQYPYYAPYYGPDYWYWNPYGYGYPYYGSYGLGFFYYDPMWWGYPGYYYSGYSTRLDDTGALRLKLRPRNAEVLVDGYYVGIVDEFDGVFQRLRLETGGHRIEVRAEGYEPLVFDVLIPPFETVTYTGELKKKNP